MSPTQNGLSEWIDDHNAANISAVIHIFRIQFLAAQSPCCSNHCAIPVGKTVFGFYFQRIHENRDRIVLNGESKPGTNQSNGDVLG